MKYPNADYLYCSAVKPVAILVDGGFFLKRYRACYQNGATHSPEKVADNMYTMLMKHVNKERLYRILFYDCPPLEKKAHNPVTGKSIDFSKTDAADFRRRLHTALKAKRKVALRLGYLQNGGWFIDSRKTKELLEGHCDIKDLQEGDVTYNIRQKSVDMKIGLDIATLAYKSLVDRIILVSGDADFVPAAKLARREGIDFILDPMWNRINPSLHEHIDGLKSTCPRPGTQKASP